jgi:hypothetical protein
VEAEPGRMLTMALLVALVVLVVLLTIHGLK